MSWRGGHREGRMSDVKSKSFDLAQYYKDYDFIIGIDESGWGPIAGPLVCAAVVLDHTCDIPEFIRDSKKLSTKSLARAEKWIKENSISYWVTITSAEDVASDPSGSRKYGFKWVRRSCLASLYSKFADFSAYTYVDGNVKVFPEDQATSVIKGDQKIPAIAAASILAKTVRDRKMEILDKKYPEFNWKQNKGYATKEHIELLNKHGPSKHHRRNTRLVKSAK